MAPQIPGFFKIVLQRNIDSSSLKLPTDFTREHGDELTDVAELVVSDGRIWKVGLRREGNRVSLRNGFDDFARHYSLSHGHLLVFKFKGMSCFSVAIFDQTNCEITYPSHNLRTREEENNAAPAFNSTANQSSSTRGISTPRQFRSERPFFQTSHKQSYGCGYQVYIPIDTSKFITRAQLEKGLIWLETGDGRQWYASLMEKRKGYIYMGRLFKFFKDNNLKDKDICIFELAKEDLFKVLIFPAN